MLSRQRCYDLSKKKMNERKKERKMERITKVRQLENKNQFIMEDDEKTIFQSYNSVIAIFNKKTRDLTLGCDWDYSRTTLKHLYIFLRDVIYYNMTPEQRQNIMDALQSANTKKAIQKLIDNKKINYESGLI